MFLRVYSLGDDTIGAAIDRATYVLTDLELQNFTYALVGKIAGFSPPTLHISQAIPFDISTPDTVPLQTYDTPPGQA